MVCETVKFWSDGWLGGQAPRQLAPLLFTPAARKNLIVKEARADRWQMDGRIAENYYFYDPNLYKGKLSFDGASEASPEGWACGGQSLQYALVGKRLPLANQTLLPLANWWFASGTIASGNSLPLTNIMFASGKLVTTGEPHPGSPARLHLPLANGDFVRQRYTQ